MRRPVVLNVEPDRYSAAARTILECETEVRLESLDRPALLAGLAGVDVLITRLGHRLDDEVFAAAPRLRAVASATTGLDHIDLEAAERCGVTVLSLRGETAFLDTVPATAEHTFALLLAVMRRLPAAHADVLGGHWRRDLFRGHDLRGKVLGIVGHGRVGRRVRAIAAGFEMTVIATDCHSERSERDFATLVGEADIISLHVPLDASTRRLIGRREFDAMKPHAVLVNTSRGGVVDQAALADALEAARLGGAALDVLEDESHFPSAGAQRLIALARAGAPLVLTPHLGGATEESMAMTECFIARKIVEFLRRG